LGEGLLTELAFERDMALQEDAIRSHWLGLQRLGACGSARRQDQDRQSRQGA